MSKIRMLSEEEITKAYGEQLEKAIKPIQELGFYAAIYYQDIQHLEGKILTIVDASFVDREQRKAVKDLIRRAIWFDWCSNLEAKTEPKSEQGMPNLEY